MTDDELGLRKLNTPRLVAPTLAGGQEIEYELLHRTDGRLYIRMLDNSGGGDLSKHRFELNSVLDDLDGKAKLIRGIHPDGILGQDSNRNTKGFLQAVVNHLLSPDQL